MMRIVVGALVLVLALGILLVMWFAWRARTRRDAAIPTPRSWPTDAGAPVASFDLAHVATTNAGHPLERIAVAGLTYPGPARMDLRTSAVAVAVQGESPVVITGSALVDVGVATWTIDRAVETDGLVRLTWRLNGVEVDTYVRILDPDARDTVLSEVERVKNAHTMGLRTEES